MDTWKWPYIQFSQFILFFRHITKNTCSFIQLKTALIQSATKRRGQSPYHKQMLISQSSLSWHMLEPLGMIDNSLRIWSFFFWSEPTLVWIVIVFKTSPLCKIYAVNACSSVEPWYPLNSRMFKCDITQLGTLVGCVHPLGSGDFRYKWA